MRTFVTCAFVLISVTSCLGDEGEANAPTLAPGFKVLSTKVELPPNCRPDSVRERVAGAVESFNLGRAESFADAFLEAGQLAPYDVGGRGFVGRAAIEGFVSERHNAGDGWTLAALSPPLGRVGLPREAAYGADLIVVQKGSAFRKREGAKVVIDCVSGLIRA
jgi:hypothetical protein